MTTESRRYSLQPAQAAQNSATIGIQDEDRKNSVQYLYNSPPTYDGQTLAGHAITFLSATSQSHVFLWDTFASKFFGQPDPVPLTNEEVGKPGDE